MKSEIRKRLKFKDVYAFVIDSEGNTLPKYCAAYTVNDENMQQFIKVEASDPSKTVIIFDHGLITFH